MIGRLKLRHTTWQVPAGGSSLAGTWRQAWVYGEASETLPTGNQRALLWEELDYELEHHMIIKTGSILKSKKLFNFLL